LPALGQQLSQVREGAGRPSGPHRRSEGQRARRDGPPLLRLEVVVRRICDDLEAEHASLDALVSGLETSRWDTSTPAEGWTVRDQIAHLAYSDVSARLAVVDAEAWRREFLIEGIERERRQREVGSSRSPAELLAWWRECRRAMLAAFRPLDRRARIPWF